MGIRRFESVGESSTQDPDYEEDVEMMKESLKIRKNYKSKQWKYFTSIHCLGRFMKMNGKENSMNYIQARSSQKWRDYKAAMIKSLKIIMDVQL